MLGKKLLFVVFFGLITFSVVEAAPTGLPSGFSATTLTNSGLGTPTSVRIAPNGRIFIFDLYGSIKIYTPGSGFTTFGSVSVTSSGDRGLLGATFDRDFNNHPYLYIHYVDTDRKVRIGRFNASTNTGTSFTDLYTAPMASEFQHAGGGITIGNDNNIYFGIGDSGTPNHSQNLTNPHGKIHRIARDGSIPANNPNWNSGGALSSIYASGFRNPFRLHTDKNTGEVYVGDVGYNAWEEINRLVSGKNYGWPIQEGPCNGCGYENPIYWYSHDVGQHNAADASIVAGPIYRGSLYPSSYQGKMFVSDYVRGFIRTINPASSGTNFTTFSTANGPVIDMDFGPDGKLYFVTIFGPVLYRVDYTGGNTNLPPVANASANKVVGASPLAINFSSNGSSDPEGASLTYSWNFGDGSTSNQAHPTKTYNTNGQYTVSLSVSDGTNTTPANNLTIKVGTPPTVTINAPTTATTYAGGETINYNASAVASNGSAIAGNQIKTTVRLHHSDHAHPFLGPLNNGVGNFITPTSGEFSPDVWLKVIFEATDSIGLTSSSSIDIYPRKSTLTLATVLAGLPLTLDGTAQNTPQNFLGVVGMNRTISAPQSQSKDGVNYNFSHWSQGGGREQALSFPNTNTTLTAHYTPVVVPTATPVAGNLIKNFSFEDGNSNPPQNWLFNRWGNNDSSLSYSNEGFSGARSARLNISSRQSGEVRLEQNGLGLEAGKEYRLQYQFKSSTNSKVLLDLTKSNGTHQYLWLGNNSSSGNWREQTFVFTVPLDVTNVLPGFYLENVGFVQIDHVSIVATGNSLPTPPPPVPPTLAPTSTATSTDHNHDDHDHGAEVPVVTPPAPVEASSSGGGGGGGGGKKKYKVSINSGDRETSNPVVSLTLTPVKNSTQMKVSNLKDLSTSPWLPFASTYPWQLLEGIGKKTVYVGYGMNDKSVGTAKDEINLTLPKISLATTSNLLVGVSTSTNTSATPGAIMAENERLTLLRELQAKLISLLTQLKTIKGN